MLLQSTSVALCPCKDYAGETLDEALERAISAVAAELSPRGRKVVIKPNLISVKRGSLACTEAAFIVAASRWFVERGARVVVGDSPAFGSATTVLAKLGVMAELQALGVGVSDFTQSRKCRLSSGVMAAVAREALDCDLLVNLPRVKAHAQTRITLAVKNCFGCLTGLQKPYWHMLYGGKSGPFVSLLLELLALLPETLTIVDGVRAMHETGPIDGEPYPLELIAAGRNPIAVDTALLEVLGAAGDYVPLAVAALRAGYRGSRLSELDFPLADPEAVAVHDFVLPKELKPIRFSILSFILSTLRRKFGGI